MQKQTKMIRFMFIVLIILPIALFVTAVIQTFVLKAKQNELLSNQYQLEQSTKKEEELSGELEYKESEEYIYEYHKHNNGYGEDGDIKLS